MDAYIVKVQNWLNGTYGSDSRFEMLPVTGDVAYSLAYDPAVTNAPVYYIAVSADGSSAKTTVNAYYPSRRSSTLTAMLSCSVSATFMAAPLEMYPNSL